MSEFMDEAMPLLGKLNDHTNASKRIAANLTEQVRKLEVERDQAIARAKELELREWRQHENLEAFGEEQYNRAEAAEARVSKPEAALREIAEAARGNEYEGGLSLRERVGEIAARALSDTQPGGAE